MLETGDVIPQRIAQVVVGRVERGQVEWIDADGAAWTEADVLAADVMAQRAVLLLGFGVDDDTPGAAAILGGLGAGAVDSQESARDEFQQKGLPLAHAGEDRQVGVRQRWVPKQVD